MLTTNMSNSTATLSEDISVSSVVTKVQDFRSLNPIFSSVISAPQQQQKPTKKRSLPGNPDPEAEVVALSPRSLLATNRYVCEVCSKGFQRDQNLQLHRRGHNLPWKLRQRGSTEIRKKVYVCPENSCVHHNPSRALGDLTGIKKHYCRKHGEKKWKCEKCSKRYAVQSDWKAHSKTCGTREYRCDCGTLFSRKDSFITHRAFCDALAEESARLFTTNSPPDPIQDHHLRFHPLPPVPLPFPFSPAHASWTPPPPSTSYPVLQMIKPDQLNQIPNFINNNSLFLQNSSNMSATQLLQQAVNVGDAAMSNASQTQSVTHHIASASSMMVEFAGSLSRMSGEIPPQLGSGGGATWKTSEGLTRDFLGLADGEDCGVDGVNVNVREMLSYTTRAIEIATCIRGHPLLRPDGGLGFTDQSLSETWEGNC